MSKDNEQGMQGQGSYANTGQFVGGDQNCPERPTMKNQKIKYTRASFQLLEMSKDND